MGAAQNLIPPHRAALDVCFAHTDLEKRLVRIPATAACRGGFFNMLDDRAGTMGAATQREYRSFFQLYRFVGFKFYPLRDYLTRIVVLSQIHYGGPGVYAGLAEIQSAAFTAWRSTLLGRATIAIARPTLIDMLRTVRLAWSGNQLVNYSRFDFSQLGPTHIVTHFVNEFNYIQYAMKGGLQGTADVCGTAVRFEVDLRDDFNGDIHIHLVEGPAPRPPETK